MNVHVEDGGTEKQAIVNLNPLGVWTIMRRALRFRR